MMLLRLLPLALAGCMLTGCAGYQLGTTLPQGLRTIYVPTLINETSEPGVDTETTSAVIQEFQRDGTVRVASADLADLRLEGTVVKYAIEPLRYREDRATTADEYRIRLTADIVVTHTDDGSVFMRRNGVQGEATFILTGDMRSAKQDALPDAARDLAHDIVEAIVEHW